MFNYKLDSPVMADGRWPQASPSPSPWGAINGQTENAPKKRRLNLNWVQMQQAFSLLGENRKEEGNSTSNTPHFFDTLEVEGM